MEHKTTPEMLDLMLTPAFFVKNNRITQVNEAAARLFLREDLPLEPILQTGAEDYAALKDGMLYVTLSIHGLRWGAAVTRMDDRDIFVLDQPFESPELRILALAARELRGPLSSRHAGCPAAGG